MFKKQAILNLLVPILVVVLGLLAGIFFLPKFSQDPFRKSCKKSWRIIRHSHSLLKEVSSKNILDEKGKIKSVLTRFDSREAIAYLESKEKELNKHCLVIKNHLKKSNEHYYDALFLLAYINNEWYLTSGEEFEDKCLYIRMIKDEKDVMLSEWVTDDIFGPYLNIDEEINDYLKMSYEKKYEMIYKNLMVPEKEGEEKCGSSVLERSNRKATMGV